MKSLRNVNENGVIIGKNGVTVAGYNNVLTIAPPLNISDEDIETVVKVVSKAIKELK